jgi:hypothetical protein
VKRIPLGCVLTAEFDPNRLSASKAPISSKRLGLDNARATWTLSLAKANNSTAPRSAARFRLLHSRDSHALRRRRVSLAFPWMAALADCGSGHDDA